MHRGEGTVTLLLTAPMPAGMRGLRVHSRLLCDRHDDQITVVRVADGHRRRTLLFVNGDGAKLAVP